MYNIILFNNVQYVDICLSDVDYKYFSPRKFVGSPELESNLLARFTYTNKEFDCSSFALAVQGIARN